MNGEYTAFAAPGPQCFRDEEGPIRRYSFGAMTIYGAAYDKDLRIAGGRVLPGWWRALGHRVALADLEDILAEPPEVMVVGTGASGKMIPEAGLSQQLAAWGVRLVALPTAEAAAAFNRLARDGKAVAGAFHLTC